MHITFSNEVIRLSFIERKQCAFTFPIIKGFTIWNSNIFAIKLVRYRFSQFFIVNPSERPKHNNQTNQYGQCCTTFGGIFLILVSVWGFGGYEHYNGPDELWTQSAIILGIGLRNELYQIDF